MIRQKPKRKDWLIRMPSLGESPRFGGITQIVKNHPKAKPQQQQKPMAGMAPAPRVQEQKTATAVASGIRQCFTQQASEWPLEPQEASRKPSKSSWYSGSKDGTGTPYMS